jgi:hypothetical protein
VERKNKLKKGRRYIEPMIGKGDKDIKKRDIKKIKKEAGKSFDGVSRPSNDEYREEYNRIFGEWKSSEENNE